MIYGSVCSGIEAATVAWHPLGWRPAFFSEIEAFPRAVLAHHYPETPCHGDFTTIGADEYGPIDLLVGGTPCQSFSIAGLRGGLDDDRGNLALEFLRLADRTRPRWLVWENVPGVLSSNGGRDFGSILGGLVELGYGFAYRVLDAQHFGVPQRRRRVFVVGYLGDWRRAAAVLFERHSLSGHPAPRRKKGEVAPTVPSRSTGGGGLGTDFDCDGGLIGSDWPADVAPTLDTTFSDKMGYDNQHVRGGADSSFPQVAMCLNAGAMGRRDAETETLIPAHRCGFDDAVTHSLRGEGFDASEDGTGRGTPLVPVAFGGQMSVPQWDFDLSQTLQAKNPTAIAFTAKDYGADAMADCSPTLRAGGFADSHQNGGVMPAVAYAIQERAVSENLENGPQGKGFQQDLAYTLEARNKVQSVAASAVRRLTPRECERLQGFPEVQKCYTILVCRDLSDQQKANALAELQFRKLQSNAWTAGVSGWMLSAEAAAHHSNISLAAPAPPVVLDVLIDLERQAARLHSAGKSFSPASNAGERSEFPLPTGIDSFARLAALLTHAWALAMPHGRAGSQPSTKPSSPLWSGSGIAISCGRETGEPAADVATAIETASRLSTSITLPSGLDTETLRSTLTTLSCCVAHAIDGCIPEQTRSASCYAVRLTTTQGYTAIPWRKKPADQCPDGPRYKALGNSMAVPVMRWIGERIQMVDKIAETDLAA